MRATCPNCSGELIPRPRRKQASRSFAVVHGNLDHLDAAATLFNEYRAFYGQDSDVEGARRFLRDRIANQESVLFLAIASNGALGFAQLYPSFTSVGMARGWILNDLFVNEKARGKGVATALIERARAFAQSTGAAWLKLETANTNSAARALYGKVGFVRDGGFEHHTLAL